MTVKGSTAGTFISSAIALHIIGPTGSRRRQLPKNFGQYGATRQS
ncbi:hypothetical protein [Lichenifustis flavocetrariae]|nr:hypothetical protein [Lichenifustis flavocetrariae]